jgi:hypothetical protein
MKVSLEFEVSAKEIRQILGLPDVEQLQREVIDAIRERMVAGVEGFDPLSLMRSFFTVAQSFPGVDSLQKLLRAAAARATFSGGGAGTPE